MENKKSFVLYVDTIHVVNKVPDEIAGKLLKLILAYVNDENPTVDDLMLDVLFEPIKQQLKRDLNKWKSIREKRSEAGKKGGLKSGESRQNKPNEPNDSFVNQNEPVNVNVNVNVNDNVINKDQSKIDFDLLINHFNEAFGKKSRIIPENVKKSYNARVKEGYTIEEIKDAMKNASKDKFHIESQYTHCTLEFFSRGEKIDKFATRIIKKEKYIPTK